MLLPLAEDPSLAADAIGQTPPLPVGWRLFVCLESRPASARGIVSPNPFQAIPRGLVDCTQPLVGFPSVFFDRPILFGFAGQKISEEGNLWNVHRFQL